MKTETWEYPQFKKNKKNTLQSTTNQIFFRHKAENEAINGSQVIFAVNQVKNSEHPADKENLKRQDMNQVFKDSKETEAVTDFDGDRKKTWFYAMGVDWILR